MALVLGGAYGKSISFLTNKPILVSNPNIMTLALALGDAHGRIDKVKAFLAYKPEEKHVFVGDYVDSFTQPDMIIYETLKTVIESDATLILGNHDIHYLDNAPFRCSGYRQHIAQSLNQIFEAFIDRFVPCAVEDGFIITHGGITQELWKSLFKTSNVADISRIINEEWKEFIKYRDSHYPQVSRIFNIPEFRGGSHGYGGIFWADWRDEVYCPVGQIFGHSKTSKGVAQIASNHWALGCDDDIYECFNTTTGEVEVFGGRAKDAA